MPPKAHVQRAESESSAKRARKSVERLSSSKLQANQYSPVALAGFQKDARHQDAKPGEAEVRMPTSRAGPLVLCDSLAPDSLPAMDTGDNARRRGALDRDSPLPQL
jgi:hypothetical protein